MARRSQLRGFADTTILFAGLGWPRWPHEFLHHALRGDFTLVLSPTVVDETRRKLAQKAPSRLAQFEEFLTLCPHELVEDPAPEEIAAHRSLMHDVTDLPIALTAIKARVDYLVSEDKHFTRRDSSNEALHRQVAVLLTGAFLRTVLGWTGEQLEAVRGRNWSDLMPKGARPELPRPRLRLTVPALNAVGDWLRDRWDPRLRA